MNNPEKDWPLVDPCDNGIRPAGAPDACFYCKQKVGQPHARDCVIVKKLVRCRVTFEVDLDVPHAWMADDSLDWAKDQILGFDFKAIDEWNDVRFRLHDPFAVNYVGVVDETPRRELRNAN